jgi:endo-1,4-beta-xylanase
LNRQKGLIYDDNLKPKPAFDSILVRLQTYEPPQDTAKQDTSKTDSTKTDSTKTDTTSNDSTIAIKTIAGLTSLSMHLSGRTLFIAGATSAKVDVFDMQGRPVFSAKNVQGSVDIKNISEGLYVVRVRDGSKSLMQRITLK